MKQNKILKWQQSNIAYCDYIDSDLVYHLYCNYRGITREVYWTDGEKSKVRADIWDRNYICGYRPRNWLKATKKDMTWYDCCLSHVPGVNIEKSFTNKKQLIKALPTLKYVYPDYYDKPFLWTFIAILKNYPQLEMIYKNDYLKPYWQYKCLYKLNKKELFNLAKFIEIDKRCDELSEKNIMNMIYLMKHPNIKTKEQWENIKWLNRVKKLKHPMLNTYGVDYKDIAQYLKKQYSKIGNWNKDGVIREYIDYLNLCDKLNIIGAWFPKDLDKSVSTLSKKVEKQEQSAPLLTTRKLNKYIKKLPKSNEIELVIPNTLGELIKVGNKMDNCVGSSSYDRKVKEGKSLIVVANKNNKPQECCEINLKQMKIQQLYSKSNKTDGEYHKIARVLINRFIREIRA